MLARKTLRAIFFLEEKKTMTPRSIRRAAERKAKKAALKAERNSDCAAAAPEFAPAHDALTRPTLDNFEGTTDALCWNQEPADNSPAESTLFERAPISAAQLAANRANAQLSRGPTSPEGKDKSSLNAVKTALTGRTVLLPTDDAAAYEQHLRAYQDDFRPVGARECDLVQSIADTAWRLKRIPCLEAAVFAQGHIEFAEAFTNHAPELRASMIELQTYLKYEKQLRNLQLQESRLTRRREKELAELHRLQQERRSAEQEALELVANRYLAAQASGQPFNLTANGFVFSTAEIEARLERLQSRRRSLEPSSSAHRSAKQAA